MTLLELIHSLQKEDEWTIEIEAGREDIKVYMSVDDYSFLTPEIVELLSKNVIVNEISLVREKIILTID